MGRAAMLPSFDKRIIRNFSDAAEPTEAEIAERKNIVELLLFLCTPWSCLTKHSHHTLAFAFLEEKQQEYVRAFLEYIKKVNIEIQSFYAIRV